MSPKQNYAKSCLTLFFCGHTVYLFAQKYSSNIDMICYGCICRLKVDLSVFLIFHFWSFMHVMHFSVDILVQYKN